MEEQQYLNLLEGMLKLINENGFDRNDRTGVGTKSIFGHQMRFDLSKSFPLFTHKSVFMRGIFEELMWFLRGDTNIQTLLMKDVHIWTEWRYKDYVNDFISKPENASRNHYTMKEFEQMIVGSSRFAANWGNIGKGYGFQWRRFGEQEIEYTTSDGVEEYIDRKVAKGFDQIEWVINEIKTNPTSRRLIVSGWNPNDVADVDLPPCHTLFQFFVQNGKLSCQLYQRSADLLLGVPFNIASYALLTHLIALECGLDVGEFVWTCGDAHIYSNQLEGLKEIVYNRTALQPPQILINKRDSIYDYQWEDIEILDYKNLGKVKMPVAV